MAETGVKKFEAATTVFAGQGDLIIFDAVSDYSTATFSGLTGPKSLGQIVQDSTSFNGDDPETTTIKDEQGNPITAKTAAGTIGFEFDVASTSAAMLAKLLNGEKINSLGTNANFDGTVSAVGFGVDLPVQTLPIMMLNDEKKRAFLYPKAKLVSSIKWEDGLARIHVVVTCEYLNTATLKTAMVLEGVPKYDTTGV